MTGWRGANHAAKRRAMTKTRWLGAAAALSILTLAACNVATKPDNAATGEGTQPAAVDKLARVEMNADTSYLTDEEKQVVNLLNQAADLLNPIYLRQVSADNPRIRDEIAAKHDPALLDRFDSFMGPWDEVDEDKPFFGSATRPVGGGLLSGRPDQGAVRRLSGRPSGRGRRAEEPLYGGQAPGR